MRDPALKFSLILAALAVMNGCSVRVAEDVAVEMRDGTHLLTDIYLPPGRGPFPIILSRTPYGTRTESAGQQVMGQFFAENGIGYIAQSIRGRFGSEGIFDLFDTDQDSADAYDSVDWIVSQEWSNGIVGVMGDSYAAYTALAAAASGHSAIKAVASAGYSMANEHRVRDGAFPLLMERDRALRMDDPDAGQYQDVRSIDLYHLPLISMGEQHGLRDRLWRQRVRGYLDRASANRARALDDYEKVRVPALHIGGWYHTESRGSIATWEGVKLYSGDEYASEMQWLVMGPWDIHAMSAQLSGRDPQTRIGRREIGDSASSTYADTLLEFFTYFLKREENGFVDLPRLQYFNIGDNDWHYAEKWPPPDSRLRSLFFHSDGNAKSPQDGLLDFVPAVDEAADAFIYDPRDPVTITAGKELSATDPPDRAVLLSRDDVLTYETKPLLDEMEITGPIAVEIYASSSATDTDFTAALVDVFADGYSLLVAEGILRASFRDGESDASPIEPGKIYAYTIQLGSTSYTVPAGHKLRVEISSSNFPRFARNLNNGEAFGMSDRVEVAEQVVRHDKMYPSRLILPVATEN